MSKFTSTNQPSTRKKRGKDKRTILLEAIKVAGYTEDQYWALVVQKAMDEPTLMKEVMNRLYAPVKGTAPHIEFDFPHNGTASEKAQAIETAAADGVLPIDLAAQMMGIIKERLDIHTNTELADKLEGMIRQLEGQESD